MNFEWTVVKHEPTYIEVNLMFQDKLKVSTVAKDRIDIKILDLDSFYSTSSNLQLSDSSFPDGSQSLSRNIPPYAS
jgi:hypothetical protein